MPRIDIEEYRQKLQKATSDGERNNIILELFERVNSRQAETLLEGIRLLTTAGVTASREYMEDENDFLDSVKQLLGEYGIGDRDEL